MQVETDRRSLVLLRQVALSSFHNGWVRADEGHRILLDLITEEQGTPACNAHMHHTETTAAAICIEKEEHAI